MGDRILPKHPDSDETTDVRRFCILPKSAHGVLIEIIDDYRLADGLLTGNS